MLKTRGERNNNPGNLRLGANWQGAVPGLDSSFVTFDSPTSGIRALAVLLRNYQARYGLTTIRQIITRYAPSSENNTGAYIAAVAGSMGLSPDLPVDLSDDDTLSRLVAAIIKHENGRNIYSAADILSAVQLA